MKLQTVFDHPQERSYDKGQILLYQGEKTDTVFIIKSGFVRVKDISAKGTEKILLLLGPGDIFPVIWTFSKSKALHYFYEAQTDVKLIAGTRGELIKAVKSSHEIAQHLFEYTVNRMSELMTRVETVEATSAKHKLAFVFLYLSETHAKRVAKGTYEILVPLTHQNIADMAGLSRETVSTLTKELEQDELVLSSQETYKAYRLRLKEFLEQD